VAAYYRRQPLPNINRLRLRQVLRPSECSDFFLDFGSSVVGGWWFRSIHFLKFLFWLRVAH